MQLSGAETRRLVDDVGRLHLGVSGLACLVEEERLEGALEACHLADVDGEAGAGDFHAEVEVDEVKLLQQVPVAEHLILRIGHVCQVFLDDHVAAGVLALGHVVVGDVGYVEQLVGHVGRGLVHDFLQGLVGGLELGHLGLDLVGLVFLALLHEGSDLLGELVLLGLVAVEFLLALTAQLVVFQYFLNGLSRSFEVLLLQTLDDPFSFLTDEFKCKHSAV